MLLSVFGVLLITIIQTVGAKTNFSMNGYYPVVSCPRNAFEWEASSQRLNCTNAHMYHCNQYKAIQLYEFCYGNDVFEVKKGHCLALTENGILNEDGCHYFSQGCPSDYYYSNESYKYQSCLSINGKCYTDDYYCNCLEAATKLTGTYKTKSIDAGTKLNDAHTKRIKTDTGSSGNQYKYLPGFIVTIVISLLSIGLNGYLWHKYKWKPQNVRPGVDAEERNPLVQFAKGVDAEERNPLVQFAKEEEISKIEELQETVMKGDKINKNEDLQESAMKGVDAEERNPLVQFAKGDKINKNEDLQESAMKGVDAEERNPLVQFAKGVDAEERNPLVQFAKEEEISKIEELQETVMKDNENIVPFSSRRDMNSENEIPQLYGMIFTSCTIEDTELFQLLKQKCIIGAHPGFQYLVDSRVKPNEKRDIFMQCDKNGCLLIHYAAQGGSIAILDDIIEHGSKDLLKRKCIRGQYALHFAIKFEQYGMTAYIIKKMKDNEETRKEDTTSKKTKDLSRNKQATHDENNTWGDFSPVFWVAWIGNGRLLFILKKAGFDILAVTKTGLNILHIACMSEKLKDDCSFCKNLLRDYKEINPGKTELSGWNVCHFASMSNFALLQFIVNDPELRNLILEKTESKRTCLHIACEYAQLEAVELIVAEFNSLIQCKDKHGWNALHFAAKGGNLRILEYLLQQNLDLGSLTDDSKTILHIACLEKHVDICQYAVNNFSKELLNSKTRDHKLTAVHYLVREKKEPSDGSVEKILQIFCNSEMNLGAISSKGLTVLDRAIDHHDIEVVRCVVKKEYREKCGVKCNRLGKYLQPESHINIEIRKILEKASQEMQKTQQMR